MEELEFNDSSLISGGNSSLLPEVDPSLAVAYLATVALAVFGASTCFLSCLILT